MTYRCTSLPFCTKPFYILYIVAEGKATCIIERNQRKSVLGRALPIVRDTEVTAVVQRVLILLIW